MAIASTTMTLASFAPSGLVRAPVPSVLAAEEAGWWDKLWWGGKTGISTYGDPTDHVFFYIFWVSAFFFVLLMGLMVYFAVKYRRRPGVPAEPSPAHNTALELAWSVIPLLLMAVMFLWGAKVFVDMRVPPAHAETINVTASQWAWSWVYDNGGSSLQQESIANVNSPVFGLPVGRPVKFVMSSTDVIHSFYIAGFRTKMDVFPNRYTILWGQARNGTATHRWNAQDKRLDEIDPKQPRLYLTCTEYCGDQHSQMWARIALLDDVDYRAWKESLLDTSGVPLLELGRKLHTAKGCISCHSLDGTAKTGPTWKGSWGTDRPNWASPVNDGSDGFKDKFGPNYIRESILEPAHYVREGYPNQMQSYQGKLTPRELLALITFMQSLSDNPEDRAAAEAASAKAQAESEAANAAGGTAPAGAAPPPEPAPAGGAGGGH